MPDFEECPACLVSISEDNAINRLAKLLRETFKMLDGALSPCIDAHDVDQWIWNRIALRHAIEDELGPIEGVEDESLSQ